MHKGYPRLNTLAVALYCRALPGLPFLLALPKRKQKASASSLGDPPTACRLNGTKLAFGSDNIPFHAVCTSASAVSQRTGYPPGAGGVE
ncbi:hypothetical protein D0T84_18550 [Dysgonomonas sp. 521]|nr:hypothetical protein [Dysgonomonas sp. 521]